MDEELDVFHPDPFWRRSGFWVALAATVDALLIVATPAWETWVRFIAALIPPWAAFFTAAALRRSADTKRLQDDAQRVMALLEEQRARIRALEDAHR